MLKMTKKRIVKKRVQRRKQVKKEVKKDVKNENKEKKDVSKMSRMEYEQSMLDPRFRAAMLGFNNPVGNAQLQKINQALHEKEEKNNELTQLMEAKQKLADTEQEQLRLKEQAKQEKIENQLKIQALQDKVADKDRLFKEAQERHKQEQELMKAEHQLQIGILRDEHTRAIQPIQDKINSLATRYDLQKIETQNAEEIANKTAELTKLKMAKEFQDQIAPLQKETAELKHQNELDQQIHNDHIKMMDASYNNILTNMEKQHQELINPINEQTQTLKNMSEVEQKRHDETMKLKDSVKDLMVAEFKSQIEPQIILFNERSADIKRQLDEYHQKMELIKELKDQLHQYKELETKKEFEPQIQEMNLKLQSMKNEISEKKEIYEQMKQQNEVKTQIAQAEQIVDPQKRNEYNEKVKKEKMETHQLELIHSYAKNAERAYNEKEAVRSKLIETSAKIFPDFSVEEIDKPEFKQRLIDEEVRLRKQQAEHAQRLEMANRLLDETRDVEKMKLEQNAAMARIEASQSKASEEYMGKLQTAAQAKLKLGQETEYLNQLSQDLIADIETRNEAADRVSNRVQDLMKQRPLVAVRAQEIANRKRGDKHGLVTADIYRQAEEDVNGKARQDLEALKNIPRNIDNAEQIQEAIGTIKGFGYDINRQRREMSEQIEGMGQQIADQRQQIDERDRKYQELQTKYKQAQDVIVNTDNALSSYGKSIPTVLEDQSMNSPELTAAYQTVYPREETDEDVDSSI